MEQAEPGHAQQQEGGVQRGEEDPGEACWDNPHKLRGGGSSHARQHPPETGLALSRSAQAVRPVGRTWRALTCRSCRGHQALLSLPAAFGGRAHGHGAHTVPRALLQVPEGAGCSPPAPPAGHLQAEGTRGRGTERRCLCNRPPIPVFPSPNYSFFSTPASQKRKRGPLPLPDFGGGANHQPPRIRYQPLRNGMRAPKHPRCTRELLHAPCPFCPCPPPLPRTCWVSTSPS